MALDSSDSLRGVLRRYAALREHDDPDFAARLAGLRRWQSEAVRRRHPQTLKDPPAARLLEFFIEEFYCGVDLSELTRDIDASASRINKLLPDTQAAGAALELITLAGELDQSVCESLDDRVFGQAGAIRLGSLGYVDAVRHAGRQQDRLRLLRLLELISDELAGFARSRIAFMAFKLARVPARRAGLASLYELNYGAFEVARHVKNLPALVDSILRIEQREIERTYAV